MIDPLGDTRYDLYQATSRGSLPRCCRWRRTIRPGPGSWSSRSSRQQLRHGDLCIRAGDPGRGLGGGDPRAVYSGNDRDNAFRFFRVFHEVTIVMGAATTARPPNGWRRASTLGRAVQGMDLAEAAKSTARARPQEAAPGRSGARRQGPDKPGEENGRTCAGFAVGGPVVLLGTPTTTD